MSSWFAGAEHFAHHCGDVSAPGRLFLVSAMIAAAPVWSLGAIHPPEKVEGAPGAEVGRGFCCAIVFPGRLWCPLL